jgi:hypothetical protein
MCTIIKQNISSLPILRTPKGGDDLLTLEKALEYVPVEDRAELAHEYEALLHIIKQGKGGKLVKRFKVERFPSPEQLAALLIQT